jgi:hypothetical protein
MDDLKFKAQELPTSHTEKVMPLVVLEHAHKFVLTNHPAMASWWERYNATSMDMQSVPPFRHWVRGAVVEALGKGEYVSQEVLDITAGPKVKAKYFAGTSVHLQTYLW